MVPTQPKRYDLQTILEGVLGSPYVYFQPGSNITMKYPAIVYSIDDMETKFASNLPYQVDTRYQVTLIDRNPDSATRMKLALLPKCSYSRGFKSDDLNHDVFTLYF